MRTVRQSAKLRNVLYEIRGPVAARAADLERRGIDVLKLNIGNPQPFGFTPPPAIVGEMARTLDISHGYSDSHGIPAAIEAVIDRYAHVPGFPELTRDRVFLGNGVSELITMTCQALIDAHDEVLIPSPDYPLWTAMVTLASGRAVHYRCAEEDAWNPDLVDLEAKITERTTAIVVINPNNPTGAVYPPHILRGIADIARKYSLTLLVDEIYDVITYGNCGGAADGNYGGAAMAEPAVHTHLAAVAPDLLTLTYSGLSKSSRLAGYRAGWLVVTGPTDHAEDFLHGLNLMASTRLCANVPGQQAIVAALGHGSAAADLSIGGLTGEGGRLRRSRDVVTSALNSMDGVSCVTPRGALYAFPRLDPGVLPVHDDEQLVLDLLESEHILVVHGTGFNWPTPDHLRIVFLPEEPILTTAMERLGNFLSSYRQ
ncbi:pyridoxal phosphate-dependent aminotransferase [Corynebacterium terpenotabidum]|uniref:alanine transaminase n=1 Tax=Corynebacterium terpenotabidum Y-11 TaxID=1200352 RepID=S4XC81_9CORY|nr:pyridoxal phosphate-dependent aminotransferase [Corynebacterium terpenotabidum]AGP30727.1 aminotransferase AlaT [Corynebacterium terpenotabidum Y-11]